MTSDEFSAEYRAGQCLTSDGIRTTLAQETRKGRLVLVHELATATERERRRVQNLLRQLTPNDASQVIGTYDVDGETVVVTKFLLGFTSFLGWLEAAVAESSTTVISTWENPPTMDMEIHDPRPHRRPPVEQQVAPALEDTSIRPVLESPAARPAPTPPPSQSTPSATAAPSLPTPLDEPTEGFTKLFGESSPAAPAAPPAAPLAPKQGTDDPVDFTQQFGAQVGGSTESSPGSSIEAPRGTLGVRAPEPTPSATPWPASRPTPPSDDAPSAPTSAKSPTADEPATGDFTRLFGNEQGVPAPASPKPQPVRAAPRERQPASRPSAPVIRRPETSGPPVDETGPTPMPPLMKDSSVPPPPPRVRLEALDGTPRGADPDVRRDHDARSPGPASFPPAPFSVPPLVAGPARPTAQTAGPDFRPAAPPPRASPQTPSGGGYTEVLTPARPPLNPASPRTPTPAIGQAPPPPRKSYAPLIVGLGVFVVLAAVLVTYFMMSAP